VPSTKKKIRSNQPSGDDCSSTRLPPPQKHTGSDFDAPGLTIKSCGGVIPKWKRKDGARKNQKSPFAAHLGGSMSLCESKIQQQNCST